MEVQKIVASDRASNDNFGMTVSVSGDYAIIGAYAEEEADASGSNTSDDNGAAYIFKRENNGNWNEVQKIVASDRVFSEMFGSSTGISNLSPFS